MRPPTAPCSGSMLEAGAFSMKCWQAVRATRRMLPAMADHLAAIPCLAGHFGGAQAAADAPAREHGHQVRDVVAGICPA